MAKTVNTNREFVSCLDCANGVFMQWFNNPIIAYCKKREERMVAESLRICPLFKQSLVLEREITHFDDYIEGQVLPIIQATRENTTSNI